MTDRANLAAWQTSKTARRAGDRGAAASGLRVREWTKPPGSREFEPLVEFTVFDRPNHLHVHVVEGPVPVDGTWKLTAEEPGTTIVHFVAQRALGGLMRLLKPIASRIGRREFAGYHENLRRNVEALHPPSNWGLDHPRAILRRPKRTAASRSAASEHVKGGPRFCNIAPAAVSVRLPLVRRGHEDPHGSNRRNRVAPVRALLLFRHEHLARFTSLPS